MQTDHASDYGGKRLLESSADSPLLTVVTVVFNGAVELESTILSVLNQNYRNAEYIIIDGDQQMEPSTYSASLKT